MRKRMSRFAVIGLGRFGQSLAKELALLSNSEVLAIDEDEEKVNAVKEFVTHAVTADAADESVMRSLGIKNFDAVAVCIADDMEASILISLLCKQFGVEYVVAKAKSLRHKSVLEKLGVDLVIIPEYEMGKKLAAMLANPGINDMFELGEDFSIVEVDVPKSWADMTMLDLDIRRTYGVNILVLKRESDFIFNISGETVIAEGDILVAAGQSAQLGKLTSKIAKLKEKEEDD